VAPIDESQYARQVFDLAEALDTVGGDMDLLKEITGLLIEGLPDHIGQIREGIARGNAQTVLAASHTLKGSVGNFAAKRAFDAAYRLEIMGRENTLTEAQSALADLEHELNALVEALKAHEIV
jgi:HPt (histidine-containing phosphotransfer) domain-containing protein